MSATTRGSDLATTLRFFLNPRAGWGAKLLFLAAIAYVIMPLDLIPDVAIVVGWVDDLIALLGAGTALMLALRRYRVETAAVAAPVQAYAVPNVVETQGNEVR